MSVHRNKIIQLILVGLVCLSAHSKEHYIRISGSSTAYPFIITISQLFYLAHERDAVIVESTGTGNGLKLFCLGNSAKYPDLASASRAIKPSETQLCHKNKIDHILEIKYGYDGIIIATAQMDYEVNFTRKELFLALAEHVPQNGILVSNPYKKWSDINPTLPKINIELYGPANTSGTRDEFNQIVMEESCQFFIEYKNNPQLCRNIRTDGKYIEIGNNENLIIQKLKKNINAFGIIGYNFYKNNFDTLKAVSIDSIEPTFHNIRSSTYSLSRPLFIYAKTLNDHKLTKSIKSFLETLTSSVVVGDNGYLRSKGLISLKNQELNKMQTLIATH